MSGDNGYSARPFYPGAVLRGQRVFTVDKAGRLYGCTYQVPWEPGENVKACYSWDPVGGTPYAYGCPCPLCSASRGTEKIERWKDRDHGVTVDCACGFYAITDHHNEYMKSFYGVTVPRIEGIVEGYGTVVVGSKGFRAEKAKIVALVIPQTRRNGQELQSWFDLTPTEQATRRSRCEKERAHQVVPYAVTAPTLSVADYLMSPTAPMPHLTEDIEVRMPEGIYGVQDKLAAAVRSRCSCLYGLAEYETQHSRSRVGVMYSNANDYDLMRSVPFQAIERRYGVPIYESLEKAKAEFPLVGQNQFKPPTDPGLLPKDPTARYVDPDSPDVGAL